MKELALTVTEDSAVCSRSDLEDLNPKNCCSTTANFFIFFGRSGTKMNNLQFYRAKTLSMLSLIFYSLFFWSQIVKMLQNKNRSIGLSGVMGSICVQNLRP